MTRRECQALVGPGRDLAVRKVLLAKPQTYMNLSGIAIKSVLEKNELTPAGLVLIYDELDLPWEPLRVRAKGLGGRGITALRM